MRRILLLASFAVSLAVRAWAAPCSPTLFVQAATVPSGGRGVDLVIGLINNDAIPDIAVANGDESSVSVLLGQGGGTFDPPIVTDLFSPLYSIAAGDFDGDIVTDLALGQYGQILILLGHGDGTFDAPASYVTNGGPVVTIVTGTFDANSSLDLAAVDLYAGNVTVLLGNGSGAFGSPTTYIVEGARAVTAADFTGDGELDLATSNSSYGTVSLLLGIGDGTFAPAADFLAGVSLSGIASADFDGDGDRDLVTATAGFIAVLLGNGNGTFQASLQYPSGLSSGLVATADFDADGAIDVAAAAPGFSGPNGVSILRGLGDGSFVAPEMYLNGGSSSGLAVADLDGDGLPDIVTADPEAESVSVLLDREDGSLFAAPVSLVSPGPSSPNFAQSDFDGDGHVDLAWPLYNSVGLAFGQPHGRFVQGASVAIPNSPQVSGVAAGDFTGDGKPDLVAAEYFNLWLLPGIGDGTFAAAELLFSSFQIGSPDTADFNSDGKLDILVPQGCCGSGVLLVFFSNGDGTFQFPVQTVLSLDVRVLIVAELTGNAALDLIAETNTGVALLAGNGDGTFGAPEELAPKQGTTYAATGDFDEDGNTDLLLSLGLASVELLLSNGDGTFQSPMLIGLSNTAASLAADDFDGDGNLDFAVYAGSILLFRGIGNGHFQSPIAFPTPGAPAFLASGDYDNNGEPDIVSATSSAFTTLINSRLGATVPTALSVIVGSPAVFTASAAGFGSITYQWRKDGLPLSDGGPISGSTTATLTIDPVAFTDAGSYDVVVTDSCTTATSNAATLSVEFDDVPLSNPFHDDIITIATAGITTGCTPTSYCPSADVSRAEMAVFLLKAKFGSDHVPPPPGGQIFDDVPPGSFAEEWIAELAGLGITAGCGNGNYCPNAPVTRAEMAVFLLKTLLGSGYVPPPATGIFADVPSDHFAIDWIEDLYLRGITAGCNTGPLRYCPDQAIPREQMATFLVRTFLGP